MTSTGTLNPLLVGPAVIVDDAIDDSGSDVQAILDQIESANIPLLRLQELPDLEQVRHWAGFSMIFLDWELTKGSESGSTLGLMLPDSFKDTNDDNLAEFVRTILEQIYCPIFIVSNLAPDDIKQRLRARLGDDPRLEARVMVRAKGESQSGLLDELDTWVKAHPAIYALKSWESGYAEAKHRLFADLEQMSVRWPGILWKTFGDDSVDQHFELAETLNRNILHRMNALVFDGDSIKGVGGTFERSSLHQVLHGQAVIPASQIPNDMMMQGDFYFDPPADGGAPESMLINLSAACDLVPRGDTQPEDVLVRVVTARRKSVPGTRNKVKELRSSDGTTAVLHLLTPLGVPYEVQFSSHREMRSGDIPYPRQGRLLPPYITQLFQSFALYLLRPGLPRLPDAFYLEPTEDA